MLKINPAKDWRKHHAYKNYISMYRVQTAQLQYHERQEDASRQDGDQKVLQILQNPHVTQGDQISSGTLT